MASKLGMMVNRERAEERIGGCVRRLASRGVEVGGEPKPVRDPDVQSLNEVNRVADILDAAVDRIDELKTKIADVEGVVAVRDAEIADMKAPKPIVANKAVVKGKAE